MNFGASEEKAATPEERKRKVEYATIRNVEAKNPCLQEEKLSYKCLNDNAYNRDKCEAFFANYKACKDFWHQIQLERRRNGIHPNLPPVEERAQIKAEAMKKHGLR